MKLSALPSNTTPTLADLLILIQNSTTTDTKVTVQNLMTLITVTLPTLQQAWIAPTFLNSWVNFGAPWSAAGYMKDSLGFVHLQGLVKSGTTATAIFTLPVGYRPLASIRFASETSAAFGSITIAADGTVAQALGNNTFMNLSGIVFKAEA